MEVCGHHHLHRWRLHRHGVVCTVGGLRAAKGAARAHLPVQERAVGCCVRAAGSRGRGGKFMTPLPKCTPVANFVQYYALAIVFPSQVAVLYNNGNMTYVGGLSSLVGVGTLPQSRPSMFFTEQD